MRFGFIQTFFRSRHTDDKRLRPSNQKPFENKQTQSDEQHKSETAPFPYQKLAAPVEQEDYQEQRVGDRQQAIPTVNPAFHVVWQ